MNPRATAPQVDFAEISKGRLPGLLGIEVVGVGEGTCTLRLPVHGELLAPNGFLHGGTVVALADTACGYGCRANLPDGGAGFTTIELKCNFLGTALDGSIACEARMAHGGRSTQVWDATVTNETTGATVALFRCTQLVVYPDLTARGGGRRASGGPWGGSTRLPGRGEG